MIGGGTEDSKAAINHSRQIFGAVEQNLSFLKERKEAPSLLNDWRVGTEGVRLLAARCFSSQPWCSAVTGTCQGVEGEQKLSLQGAREDLLTCKCAETRR